MKEVAPIGDEPVLIAGPDKFIGSDLEKILKDKSGRVIGVLASSML